MGELRILRGPSEIRRLQARRKNLLERYRELVGETRELERQFVEDDLRVTAGPREGQPLSAKGRRQRLSRLLAKRDEARATHRECADLKSRIVDLRIRADYPDRGVEPEDDGCT